MHESATSVLSLAVCQQSQLSAGCLSAVSKGVSKVCWEQNKLLTCLSTCIKDRFSVVSVAATMAFCVLEGSFPCHFPSWCIFCLVWQFRLTLAEMELWLRVGLHLCTVKGRENSKLLCCCSFESEEVERSSVCQHLPEQSSAESLVPSAMKIRMDDWYR